MTDVRALYLCEGSSDLGLRLHIEGIAAQEGKKILVTVPEWDRLGRRFGLSVKDKLRAARDLDNGTLDYDLAIIHRDSDGGPPEHRRKEILTAVTEVCPDLAHVPVIPVRMLEAWLLLDAAAIREVAGNPNGRVPLGLPKLSEVEREPKPKHMLKEAIAKASGEKGRALQKLQTRFPGNRKRLLQMLDPQGPVSRLASWQAFTAELRAALNA